MISRSNSINSYKIVLGKNVNCAAVLSDITEVSPFSQVLGETNFMHSQFTQIIIDGCFAVSSRMMSLECQV